MQEKPLVSFCLFTYNQENFIEEALDGALRQTYSHLEIIISDDCSTDRTYDIIKGLLKDYNGPHQIILNRNESNIGLVEHVNKVLYDISNGEYVVMAAGDDISLPNRVEESINFILKQEEEIVALSSSREIINENSELSKNQRQDTENNIIFDGSYYYSKDYKHVNGPTRVLSRKLINAFPKLNTNCNTEDTTFLLRAFLYGNVALLKDKLIKYRIHENNLSSADNLKKMRIENIFKQNISDINYAFKMNYISKKQCKLFKEKNNDIRIKRLGLKPNLITRVKNKIKRQFN